MKKIHFLLTITVIASTWNQAKAQTATNTFPATGNVGIGTTSPTANLQVYGSGNTAISIQETNSGNVAVVNYITPDGAWQVGQSATGVNVGGFNFANSSGLRMVITPTGNVGIGTATPISKFHVNSGTDHNLLIKSAAEFGTGVAGMAIQSVNDAYSANLPIEIESSMLLLNSITGGNVGVGTINPQALLHIAGGGISLNTGGSPYSGNVIIQSDDGTRSATVGASLEFVIPANTDGTNPWGQGRIITVAGNLSSSDATGKMIFGTRRYFDKMGVGTNWYYGDDITIDGSGNVGIGTTTPAEKLSVNGNIRSKKITVTQTGWPDYVFDSSYTLQPLAQVEQFIKNNKHLPGVPSTNEVQKNGLDVGDNQAVLLKKIEELTLYMIEQGKKIDEMKKDNQEMKEQNKQLQLQLQKLGNSK